MQIGPSTSSLGASSWGPARPSVGPSRASSPAPTSSGVGGTGPVLGSGRAPKTGGIRMTQLLLLLAKQGFQEVTPGALSDEARRELARKVRPDQAVGIYQNPLTGEVRALVQNERNREGVSMLSWNGRSWGAMAA